MNSNKMDLATAREIFVDVAQQHDIHVSGNTRGKFGGDVLLLNLAFHPLEYTVRWADGGGAKCPKEAARLIRGYAKRKGTSLELAASQWYDSCGNSAGTIVDWAIVEPLRASAEVLAHWRTAEAQAALVDAVAAEGVSVELGRCGEEGYEQTDVVPVDVHGSASVILGEYQRQVRAALGGDEK